MSTLNEELKAALDLPVPPITTDQVAAVTNVVNNRIADPTQRALLLEILGLAHPESTAEAA